MSRPLPKIILVLLTAAAGLAALSPAAGAETVAPLPESDYTVRSACQEPRAHRAGCLALQLIPVTAAARRHDHPLGMVRRFSGARPAVPTPASGFFGLRPQDLHTAYSLPTTAASTQTIALVDAYNDVTAEADLKTYDEEFGLPACTKANGCFSRIGQTGSEAQLPFPKSLAELQAAKKGTLAEREAAEEAIGWDVEISLDVQSAHATCQSCRIVLVEANTPANDDLAAAERAALAAGANEVSNSWGSPEEWVEPAEAEAFDHPGTVITASAGDDGYREWGREEAAYTSFPASSPTVVAVGGTRLSTLGVGGAWNGETVWNGAGASGGGCSEVFTAPPWQQQAAGYAAAGCLGNRLANDVAADADPYTGFVIRDTSLPGKECQEEYEEGGAFHTIHEWCTYGGTSLSSPIIAAVYALAGGADGVEFPASTLYATRANAPQQLHDVTSGSNGFCATYDEETGISECSSAEEAAASCKSALSCLAAPGYDGPSGVGTPNGILGFTPGQVEHREEVQPAAASPARIAPAPAPAAPAALPPALVELSALSIKPSATLSRRTTPASVAFAFRSNMPARVRATVARRVRSHGRARWIPAAGATTLTAAAGRNVERLRGHRRLVAGVYRLTLTPNGGRPRSVTFRVR